jgi:hypothetical protein
MNRNSLALLVVAAVVVIVIAGISLNSLFANQEQRINILQGHIADLENETASLENQVSDLQNALELTQKALEEARTPTLSNWNDWLYTELGAMNVPGTDTPTTPNRLYIQGKVWNTGNDTAYDCKLHVILYRDLGLYELYIDLGNIAPEAAVNVNENIVYTGELRNWDILPVFTKPS